MKYPSIISFESVAKSLDQFDSIIDVRSPAEFKIDQIPGAINCPVLDDEERIRVGTLYKQVNAFEAKKLGAALVAKNIGHHLALQFQGMSKDWRPLIYCWRGGNRSGSMAHILAKIGWPVAQLEGGYKAYRHYVNLNLPELAQATRYIVLCGPTGSGKSRLLEALAQHDAQVLDLEKLARHRGSVLGKLPSTSQPSQKHFETQIWQQLAAMDISRPIFIEAESKKVGDLRVPEALIERMRASECVTLNLSLAQRVAILSADYPHFIAQSEQLIAQLQCLTPLHGKEQIGRWCELARTGHWQELVHALLDKHYDPTYQRAIERNFPHSHNAKVITFEGDANQYFPQLAQQLIATYET